MTKQELIQQNEALKIENETLKTDVERLLSAVTDLRKEENERVARHRESLNKIYEQHDKRIEDEMKKSAALREDMKQALALLANTREELVKMGLGFSNEDLRSEADCMRLIMKTQRHISTLSNVVSQFFTEERLRRIHSPLDFPWTALVVGGIAFMAYALMKKTPSSQTAPVPPPPAPAAAPAGGA